MANSLTVTGLFAGIGGFERGFSEAGHRTAMLCESDSAAQAVLQAQFPDVEIVNDIAALEDLPTHSDLVLAGFPCQNLSMVGDKSGLDGQKSSVVEHLFRLLRARRVPWVVLENVPFMLYLQRGRAVAHILSQFERLGYDWAYRIIDSRGFGLPQRRRRVFIVASKEDDPRRILLSDDEPDQRWPKPDLSAPIGFYWSEGNSGAGLTHDAIPPLKTGSGLGIPTAPGILLPEGRVVTPTIEAAERLQGFPAGWTSHAAEIKRSRNRWRLVGNAVSVPVAQWIAERFADPGVYVPRSYSRLSGADRWPKAAWCVKGKRYRAAVSDTPLMVPHGTLSAMGVSDWPDVSSRAIAGFVTRARKSGLRFPDGFLDNLSAFAATGKEAASHSADSASRC